MFPLHTNWCCMLAMIWTCTIECCMGNTCKLAWSVPSNYRSIVSEWQSFISCCWRELLLKVKGISSVREGWGDLLTSVAHSKWKELSFFLGVGQKGKRLGDPRPRSSKLNEGAVTLYRVWGVAGEKSSDRITVEEADKFAWSPTDGSNMEEPTKVCSKSNAHVFEGVDLFKRRAIKCQSGSESRKIGQYSVGLVEGDGVLIYWE